MGLVAGSLRFLLASSRTVDGESSECSDSDDVDGEEVTRTHEVKIVYYESSFEVMGILGIGDYKTVTDLARFRGMSGLHPFSIAI